MAGSGESSISQRSQACGGQNAPISMSYGMPLRLAACVNPNRDADNLLCLSTISLAAGPRSSTLTRPSQHWHPYIRVRGCACGPILVNRTELRRTHGRCVQMVSDDRPADGRLCRRRAAVPRRTASAPPSCAAIEGMNCRCAQTFGPTQS